MFIFCLFFFSFSFSFIKKMHFIQFFYFLFSFVMAQELLYEPNAPDYKSNSASQSLFDKLAPDPSLSTFMDVLTQVEDVFNLMNHTNDDNSQLYTVFCPVNSAFRNELDIYTRSHLDDFLRNHIVPNIKIDSDSLAQTDSLHTLFPGQLIPVRYDSSSQKIILNEHTVVDTSHPIEAINGIAYKIDHLLRPNMNK